MPNPEEKTPGPLTRFINRLRSKGFGYLAKSLVILIPAYPYLEVNIPGQIAMTVITIFVMISLVVAVGDRKRDIIVALCPAAPLNA